MADAVGTRQDLDAPALAEVFESALAAVQKHTQAKEGDKTMMDALIPAAAALRTAASNGKDASEAMAAAAQAAAAGAEATAPMQARFGRARNLGQRSIGAPDAGATSMSLIFAGFASALASPRSSD
jgi:dihydroxyacetone kinase-like protein